jgi:hypothetical protein
MHLLNTVKREALILRQSQEVEFMSASLILDAASVGKAENIEASHKGKLTASLAVASFLLNIVQAYWSHQIQVKADDQVLVAHANAMKDAEAQRLAEMHSAAERLLEKLWPSISKGTDLERERAIDAVGLLWPELGAQLRKAAGAKRPIAERLPPAVAPPGNRRMVSPPSGPGERASGLVAQADTLAGFGLEAAADRAYLDAGRALGLEASRSATLFDEARADYDAGRFHEALQKFQRLFGSSEK